MLKRDFFIAALKAGCYKHKQWILEAFALSRSLSPDRPVEYSWPLAHVNGRLCTRRPIDVEGMPLWEPIDDGTLTEPLLTFHESIDLKPNDLENVVEAVTTTYGSALFNSIVLIYPFGKKIPFVTGKVNIKALEQVILKRIVTDPPAGQAQDDDKVIYVSEYIRYGEAIFSLVGLTQLCVASATPKSMTTDPRMGELRQRLLEENKDHLTDPVVVAAIEKQLVALDREWIKGDPSEGFFYKDKSFDVIRKRMFGMYGGEGAFGDGSSVTLIEKPLNDGWDIDNLPAMASASREGSYSRGALTELGGSITKQINRFANTSSISEEDCGSKLGLPTQITDSNKSYYLSNYVLGKDGDVLITDENLESFVGKTVPVRSVIYCKTGGVNFCAHCTGQRLAETPNAVGSYMSDIGSRFLGVFMSAMHGRKVSTQTWTPDLRIS
jgi:hypothetical protein